MSSGGSAFMARQLSSPWQRDRGFESPSLQRRVRCEPVSRGNSPSYVEKPRFSAGQRKALAIAPVEAIRCAHGARRCPRRRCAVLYRRRPQRRLYVVG